MTSTETTQLIDRHLEGWLGSDALSTPPLRDRIAVMITEAIATRDKLWSDGAETLRHERDEALRKLAAIEQARDNAIHAAHLIAEELAECKRRAKL